MVQAKLVIPSIFENQIEHIFEAGVLLCQVISEFISKMRVESDTKLKMQSILNSFTNRIWKDELDGNSTVNFKK